MSKTFEQELDTVLDNMGYPKNIDSRKTAKHMLLAAHQAEMDKVVNKYIGKQICTNDCTAPYNKESRPSYMSHSYGCRQVRMRLSRQRARYKAMKEGRSCNAL